MRALLRDLGDRHHRSARVLTALLAGAQALRIPGLTFPEILALSLEEKVHSLLLTVVCDLNTSRRIPHLLHLWVVQWTFVEMKMKSQYFIFNPKWQGSHMLNMIMCAPFKTEKLVETWGDCCLPHNFSFHHLFF